MLLREISVSRDVFAGIRRFPVGKLQVQTYFCQKLRFRVVFLCEFNVSPWGSGGFWGPSWDADPARLRETTGFMFGPKNMPARPWNLRSNLPHERGPPVDVHEETRSILQGAPQTWSHARDLGFFSLTRILRAVGK